MAHGQHAAQEIVGSTGKDTAKDNPQVGHRAELGTHDSSEDGACTGNIQKLNHEHLPRRKHDVVKTVGLGYGGRHTVIGPKHPFHEAAIEKIA